MTKVGLVPQSTNNLIFWLIKLPLPFSRLQIDYLQPVARDENGRNFPSPVHVNKSEK